MKKVRSRWFVCGMVGLAVCCAPFVNAEIGPALADASRPIEEGVPQVAAARLRALLIEPLAPADARAVNLKLVEALLASDRPDEALPLLDPARIGNGAEADFLRAQTLAALRRTKEALALYETVAADRSARAQKNAEFGAIEMLRATGRLDEAIPRLTQLATEKEWKTRAQLSLAEVYLDLGDAPNARRLLSVVQPESAAPRKIRRFLEGRLEFAEHHPERALFILEGLLKRPEGITHPVVMATLFQVADAHLQLKTAEAGDDFIEDFIERHPADPDLARIFAKLDELYRSERKPARSELERWTREPDQPRRAFAQWYLARIEMRANRRDKAIKLLDDLRASHPESVALVPALLELAELKMQDGNSDDALLVLNEASAHASSSRELSDRILLLSARAQHGRRQLAEARANYDKVAFSSSPFANVAAYDSAATSLELNDGRSFAAVYAQLRQKPEDNEARAQLRLQEALTSAARGEKEAADMLQRFVRDFPNEPQASQAWIALAELAFHRAPPAVDEARTDLARALQSKPAPATQERADYLSLWIEDAAGDNDGRVIDLANQFLRQYPDSKLSADVRMKLAELYYRRQDFANAQTHFELLAQNNPGSPLAEKALFFAGESSSASMTPGALDRAVALFNQVIQRQGELRWAARNEQAMIERKLGKPRDALALYEEVLKNDARPAEKREALCGKGDIYVDLAAEDPANYDRAIAAYDALANEAREATPWHNQALFKKATCLEKKRDRDGALTVFFQLLDTPTRPDKSPDSLWFYKAGFNAARLLEESSNWKAAAAVYEKLVAAAGPRSDEAKARLDRLRLEHFLWPE